MEKEISSNDDLRFSYSQKSPNLFLGCLLFLIGLVQLVFPIRSNVKLIIVCFTYLAGALSIVNWWKLKRFGADSFIFFTKESIGWKSACDGWEFLWEDLQMIRVPFPSGNPTIEIFFQKEEMNIPVRTTLSLSCLPQKFDFIRELQTRCEAVSGSDALAKIATPTQLFHFKALSLFYDILFIILLFAIVPITVYFLFLRPGS